MVPPFPFVTETMEKAVAPLVGSIPQLKPYTAIKGKAPSRAAAPHKDHDAGTFSGSGGSCR